jgi:pSer/pThr/pTyr-binding forkhead associated (FHA) protein
VEVFKQLNIQPDPDAGTPLTKLAALAKPPPPKSILVRLGGRVVLQRPFMPPSMTVGRDLSCELFLDNLSVSRRHARLSWDRGQFIVEDLGSANGTTVNGISIQQKSLSSSDRIGLGKFEISLVERIEATHPDRTIIMSGQTTASGSAYLVGADISVLLGQEVTIGNAPGADVQARGLWVAPIHARLRPEGGGAFSLQCTGSRKVKVNGKKVARALLGFGDQILVGRSRFTLVPSITGETTHS